MASERWCEAHAPSLKTRGTLAMSSQVMTGFMMHPRGSAAICQCRGGSITGSWSIRNDQPRPAHGREGLDIHCGPFTKTSDSLPTLTRGVAVLMAHPQRPAAMCQWQVKDGAKLMLRPYKTRGSLAMSSQVMTEFMMHPRGSAAICQCRGGSITGSWSIRNDQPRPAHEREGLNIHYGPSNKTSDSLPTLTRGVAVLMTHPQRPAPMCQWQVKDGAKFMLRPQRPAVAWQCQVGS